MTLGQPAQPPPALVAIKQAAAKNGVDWRAMASIAQRESGLNPRAIGDGGHAFGLFQFNNAGGVITGDPNPRRFLDPRVNADYTAHQLKVLGIGGKMPVEEQIRQIAARFERPADIPGEVSAALGYYRTRYAGQPSSVSPLPVAPQRALGSRAPAPAASAEVPPINASQPTGYSAQELSALQSGLGLAQQAASRAQSALGAISGDRTDTPAPINLAPFMDIAQPQTPVQAPHAAPSAPAPTHATRPAPTPHQSTPTGTHSPSGSRVAHFEGTPVDAWMLPALQYARAQGWKGKLTSGVRTTAEQRILYARYQAGGNIAAKPGQSNHEIQNGGAFDATDPETLNKILQTYTGQRPVWAMTVGLNDHPHFSLTGH